MVVEARARFAKLTSSVQLLAPASSLHITANSLTLTNLPTRGHNPCDIIGKKILRYEMRQFCSSSQHGAART